MLKEQRKMERRNLSYYLPVSDVESAEQVGVIEDISLGGFKLESRKPIPSGQVNRVRLYLTNDIAPQPSVVFAGRSKWCHPDYIDPSKYNVGFEIINSNSDDAHIIQRVVERYGKQPSSSGYNSQRYPWY